MSTTTRDVRAGALAQANRVRSLRADLRTTLATWPTQVGRRQVAVLVVAPPDWLASMRVAELVALIHQESVRSGEKLLARIGASPRRTVGQLSSRQRDELARLLGGSQ